MGGPFRTALCDLLGIEYPIVQSGMGGVAGPELAAEVSRAGALGIIAGLSVPVDELRRRIRRLRELTDRPFGVNLWLHSELRPPADVQRLPEATIRAVQGTLNRFRERLEIPATLARPAQVPDLVEQAFGVILEERVPVFSAGIGLPDAGMIRRCHDHGVKVMAMVATVEDARTAAGDGADAVIAQGAEAGGHRSVGVKPAAPDTVSVGTMAFVPQVVDAVRVPVVAAGGIADGRGLVAALALGASGILLGTRFVATRESMAAEVWKKSLLELDGTATAVTEAFTGQWARTLRNTFQREYGAAGAPVLPSLLQSSAAQDVYQAAVARADREYFPMYAGQGVGLIHDLPGAGDVVEAVVREARAVLASLPRRVQS
jgi:nitronate monooxygenase